MIQVCYGDGKGKTSAAFGSALRALGSGWRVVAVQFLKDGSSGEARLLAGLSGATVLADTPPVKFTFRMDEDEKAVARAEHDANLARALALVGEGVREPGPHAPGTLLVLDEALDALATGLLDEALLRRVLAWGAGPDCELIVTGHGELPTFVRETADYITCMRAERHPYACGVAARKGVEY